MTRKQNTETKKGSTANSKTDGKSLTSSRVIAMGGVHNPYGMHTLSQTSSSMNRLTRSVAPTVSMVKPLHDSDYKRPEENTRVIQDTNPIKSAALSDA
jgi:hypothetical protein